MIQLHTLLVQVRHVVTKTGVPVDCADYEAYRVLPQHIHKSKLQHKRALFLLGKALADTISDLDELSDQHKLGVRLADVAKKAMVV